MKPFATYRLSAGDKVRWHGVPPRGKGRYRVVLWVRKGEIRDETE